jgi:3-phenylpropionate/cinnamic acid dioxygenase small subunit
VPTNPRTEILETMARYSQYVSDRRYSEWARLFADDGQFTGPDGVRGTGPAEMETYIRQAHAGWIVKQITVNVIITVDGNSAAAQSDFIVYRKMGDEFVVYAIGRYDDELRFIDGEWRFVRRHVIPLGYGLDEGTAATGQSAAAR